MEKPERSFPDLNSLVGEYKMNPVSNIKPADTIVQFGHKIKVLEIIPKDGGKFNIVVEGKEGQRSVWENLDGTDSFRVLISENQGSSST